MKLFENCLVCRMRSEGAGGIDKSSPVVGTGLAGWRGVDFRFTIYDLGFPILRRVRQARRRQAQDDLRQIATSLRSSQ